MTVPPIVIPLVKRPADRRSARRFPIPQDVQYRFVEVSGTAKQGSGKVLDISSRGVRFTTQAALPLDSRLHLSIAWPVTLSGGAALQLVVSGWVVRSGNEEAAVRIEKYEFRTRGRAASGQPQQAITPVTAPQ